eukprot:gene3903-4896_t
MNVEECRAVLKKVFGRAKLATLGGNLTLIPKAILQVPGVSKSRISAQFSGLVVQPLSVKSVSKKVVKITSKEAEAEIERMRTIVRGTVLSLVDSESIPDDGVLMNLGLDSLGATELSVRLSKEFNLRLPPTMLFSYPSVNDIVSHLSEK